MSRGMLKALLQLYRRLQALAAAQAVLHSKHCHIVLTVIICRLMQLHSSSALQQAEEGIACLPATSEAHQPSGRRPRPLST